jgi:hypothetical protein
VTQPNFDCKTGDCTWGPFTTLAFRSLCTDISDKVVRQSIYNGYAEMASLPDDGPSISYAVKTMNGSYIPARDVYEYNFIAIK